MASYISDIYNYDIFISYSHLDNEIEFNAKEGWIQAFYDDLNLLLARRFGKADTIKIWWDNKKIDGSMEFNSYIEDSIKQSAIIICLLSPGYMQSKYCLQELKSFHDKALQEPTGLFVNYRSRIFTVLLNNIPIEQWPQELSGRTSFKFNDGKDKDDLGDPFEINSDPFKNTFKDLRDALVQLIIDFKNELASPPPPPKFTIFFGDVSDSLCDLRDKTVSELKVHDELTIVSDIPPPYEEIAHEDLVKEKLQTAKLTVHLFDQFPGRKIQGTNNLYYPQTQAELSFASQQTQLIWVPLDMNINNISNDAYKTFLSNLESGKSINKTVKYIRGIGAELTQQILDISNKIQLEDKKPQSEKISILLDTHYDDQLYALDLSRQLIQNGLQPFINPEEDDPKKNITILDDRISQVNKLVFFYGKVSSSWITERINAALQLIISNHYAQKDFYVFMIPPHKNNQDLPPFNTQNIPVNIINCSDVPQLNNAVLQQFFKSINVTA